MAALQHAESLVRQPAGKPAIGGERPQRGADIGKQPVELRPEIAHAGEARYFHQAELAVLGTLAAGGEIGLDPGIERIGGEQAGGRISRLFLAAARQLAERDVADGVLRQAKDAEQHLTGALRRLRQLDPGRSQALPAFEAGEQLRHQSVVRLDQQPFDRLAEQRLGAAASHAPAGAGGEGDESVGADLEQKIGSSKGEGDEPVTFVPELDGSARRGFHGGAFFYQGAQERCGGSLISSLFLPEIAENAAKYADARPRWHPEGGFATIPPTHVGPFIRRSSRLSPADST